MQRVVPQLECIARLLTNCSSSCAELHARPERYPPPQRFASAYSKRSDLLLALPFSQVAPDNRSELMLPHCLACQGHTVLACRRLAGRRRMDSHPRCHRKRHQTLQERAFVVCKSDRLQSGSPLQACNTQTLSFTRPDSPLAHGQAGERNYDFPNLSAASKLAGYVSTSRDRSGRVGALPA